MNLNRSPHPWLIRASNVTYVFILSSEEPVDALKHTTWERLYTSRAVSLVASFSCKERDLILFSYNWRRGYIFVRGRTSLSCGDRGTSVTVSDPEEPLTTPIVSICLNTTSELQTEIASGKLKRHSPKIIKSPLAAAAISGVLSWCSGRLLGARRTGFSLDVGMRDKAWYTSRMLPRSSASSKALWVTSSSLLFTWKGSLQIFADRKPPWKYWSSVCQGKLMSIIITDEGYSR